MPDIAIGNALGEDALLDCGRRLLVARRLFGIGQLRIRAVRDPLRCIILRGFLLGIVRNSFPLGRLLRG